ncbi:MAG TPA: STAS domain-containing protein [Acidimicrobiales bacterium]|nr:STAS domain-containing protein [Acidimicrobiales bacterium]
MIIDGRPAVRGECDMSNASKIEQWLAGFSGDPLEVDMSEVTFFDASALRAILNARRHNPNLHIVQPSNCVLRVLELTGTIDCLADGR